MHATALSPTIVSLPFVPSIWLGAGIGVPHSTNSTIVSVGRNAPRDDGTLAARSDGLLSPQRGRCYLNGQAMQANDHRPVPEKRPAPPPRHPNRFLLSSCASSKVRRP